MALNLCFSCWIGKLPEGNLGHMKGYSYKVVLFFLFMQQFGLCVSEIATQYWINQSLIICYLSPRVTHQHRSTNHAIFNVTSDTLNSSNRRDISKVHCLKLKQHSHSDTNTSALEIEFLDFWNSLSTKVVEAESVCYFWKSTRNLDIKFHFDAGNSS